MSINRELPDEFELGSVVFKAHPERRFAVSACGQVVGRLGRVLKQKSNGCYKIVSYQHQPGMIRQRYVHRLVAAVWCPNPDDLPEVNHVDGNKLNNAASNLEWVDRRGNVIHAIGTGLIWNTPKRGQRGFQCRS